MANQIRLALLGHAEQRLKETGLFRSGSWHCFQASFRCQTRGQRTKKKMFKIVEMTTQESLMELEMYDCFQRAETVNFVSLR